MLVDPQKPSSPEIFLTRWRRLDSKANLHDAYFADLPLATVRCIPSQTAQQSRTESNFDRRSLQELECGKRLSNIGDLLSEDLLQLEALASRPELLTEEDILKALELLRQFKENHQEVT